VISKHVSCKARNDDYGRLARYVADAGHGGEKCLVSWSAGCWSGDDYDLGILEAEAVQDLNTRSAKEKTYHLLISFRPEDEAKLTPEAFKALRNALPRLWALPSTNGIAAFTRTPTISIFTLRTI
jgi:hypothetical protein